jgi:hypothetical protein
MDGVDGWPRPGLVLALADTAFAAVAVPAADLLQRLVSSVRGTTFGGAGTGRVFVTGAVDFSGWSNAFVGEATIGRSIPSSRFVGSMPGG